MWALVGERNEVYQDVIGGPFSDHREEEVVALFSSEEKAREYERKARLKNSVRRSFASVKKYRSNSLLSEYEDAWVEEFFEPEYPIDPEI